MRRLPLTIPFALLLASSIAVASNIYQWTDADGNVHYEDRPVGQNSELRRDIQSARTDNSAVQARLEARREALAAAEQVAEEAPAEMSQAEIRAEQQKRQEECQKHRARLESFLRSQRLYREDESGERNYLSEEEVLAARERAQAQIEEYCGS